MTAFHLYAAGTRSIATLIDCAPDYAAALDLWTASQGSDRPAWSIVPANPDAFPGLDSIAPGYDLGKYGRGVYVTRSGGGVGTRGFQSLADQAARVADWLALEITGDAAAAAVRAYRAGAALPVNEPGTPGGYGLANALLGAASAHCAATGRRCPVDLTPSLAGLEGKRVEVVDCHGDRRRFWVGKSGGWLPIHLEIASRRESGGCGVYGAPFASVRVLEG